MMGDVSRVDRGIEAALELLVECGFFSFSQSAVRSGRASPIPTQPQWTPRCLMQSEKGPWNVFWMRCVVVLE